MQPIYKAIGQGTTQSEATAATRSVCNTFAVCLYLNHIVSVSGDMVILGTN